MSKSIGHSILAMSTLAERLRERAAELGVTQAQLARYTGAKEPSVSKWFSGATKNLKGKNLVRAAELLQVSEAWLADGVGPKERKFVGGTLRTISAERYNMLTDAQKAAIEEWVDAQITAYTGVPPAGKSATAA